LYVLSRHDIVAWQELLSLSILMCLCFKHLRYVSHTCAICGQPLSWGHLCSVCGQTWSWGQDTFLLSVWTDIVLRRGALICAVCVHTWLWGQDTFLLSVWTDIVTRTGHLFVHCVDRQSDEDRTLICAMCGQTQSRRQNTYLSTVWADIVMRTGHLFVQCVCGQTWSQGQDTGPHAPRKIDLHHRCPIWTLLQDVMHLPTSFY
jgi:hypothetical protein